jgi:tetratricopeptide (TPR) repeat protein
MTMKKTSGIFFATALLLLSIPALANHCPQDMKQIDEALAANPQISAEQMETVKKLRAEGEALHKEGKHQESLEALGKALEILGVNRG